ncbi:PucC family protein [Synechococcus sp. TAK9802]|uniref:PucC family protein n=1 Tax=Synechococcus sp. TAK9802 TaxID=1442558 RepID=UPI001648DABC|nr:PucC family protein [Synechococcus sp. TAK9802]QNI62208.1 major facilitator superfamily protein/ PucC-like protein [Synechococcus sp. TAK9802]
MGTLTLGLRLGLFQLSLGILGVLILGLLNRLLIQDIQVPAVLAALALLLMLWAGSGQSIPLLRTAVGLFGLSLGVCMNACLTLMFSFVQPGRTGFLLGVWGGGLCLFLRPGHHQWRRAAHLAQSRERW